MIFSKSSISDFLFYSKEMIAIALKDEEIKQALSKYNYTEELLNEGWQLYQGADQLQKEATATFGQKLEAGAESAKKQKAAHAVLMQFVNFTRKIYKDDPEKLAKLKIHVRVERKVASWFIQSNQFYSEALKDTELHQELLMYGVTLERLQEGFQLLKDAETAREERKMIDGKSQDLTTQRDASLEKLNDWITGFALVCKYALVDSPQLQEKLGIKVYSAGYKKPTDEKKEKAEKKEEAKEEKE